MHKNRYHYAFLCAAILCAHATPANAEIYKCVIAGKTTYSNTPCAKDAKPATLKGNVTVVESKHLAPKAAEAQPAQRSVLGVKVPNPIAECKARGGTIDKELRACMLP